MARRLPELTTLYATVLIVAAVLAAAVAGQRTFVPNGRYGRRADIPPIVGVQSLQNDAAGDEMPPSIVFGERVLASPMFVCIQAGIADYYRCTRRTGSNYDDSSQ